MDNQLKNIDQLLTNDVDKFCSTLVDVYSNVAKVGFYFFIYSSLLLLLLLLLVIFSISNSVKFCQPFLDIVVYIQRLSVTYTGLTTPGAMIGYLMFAGILYMFDLLLLLLLLLLWSGGILTSARRPLTRMTLKENQLEGELRFVHSRLIANCEEIAFYQGNVR